jgi:hypothetical protein
MQHPTNMTEHTKLKQHPPHMTAHTKLKSNIEHILNENEAYYQSYLVPLCQYRHYSDRTMMKCGNK